MILHHRNLNNEQKEMYSERQFMICAGNALS